MADKAASASPADTNTDTVQASGEDRTDVSSASEGRKVEDEVEVKGIDIVRDVLGLDEDNQPKEASPASPSEKEGDTDDKKAGDTDDTKAEGDKPAAAKSEPRADVLEAAEKSKFRDDPVFRKVTSELRETRGTIEAQKPLITFATNFGEMLKTTNISPDQLQTTIELTALMNSDPHKAREAIAKILADLDVELGNTLPEDLRKKVQNGDMDEADAKRVARAEADAQRARDAEKLRTEQSKRATADENVEKQRATVKNAVESRLSVIASGDPDFKAKEQQLMKEVSYQLTLRKSPLKTVDDAIGLVNDAYAQVNKFFDGLQPTKGARKPAQSGSEATNSRKTVADLPPTASGLDVTRAALGLT